MATLGCDLTWALDQALTYSIYLTNISLIPEANHKPITAVSLAPVYTHWPKGKVVVKEYECIRQIDFTKRLN